MNQDNRNLVLAIVCSALLVIGYQIFYELPKQQALEEQALLEQKDLILTAPEQTSNNEKIAETSIQQTEIVNAPRITIDTPSIEGSISLAGARIDDIVLKTIQKHLMKTHRKFGFLTELMIQSLILLSLVGLGLKKLICQIRQAYGIPINQFSSQENLLLYPMKQLV